MDLKRKIAYLITSRILGRDDLAEVMWDRVPDWKTFFRSSLNHLLYFLRLPYAPYLTTLVIEVTNRCNLKCTHCPTKNMKRARGDIDPELVKRIIDENKRLSYIYFYNWGEPMLHPDLWDIIRYARERGIKTALISNGTLLSKDIISKIFASGLSMISFSIDGVGSDYTKERGFDYKKLKEGIMEFVVEKKVEGASSPRIELNVVLKGDDPLLVDKIEEEWREHVDAINYQPLIKYEEFSRKTPCRELWKGNLVVLWDGRVTLCCVDYEGVLILGDATKERLIDIWKGAGVKRFRMLHRRSNFMSLCKMCSEVETTKAPRRFS